MKRTKFNGEAYTEKDLEIFAWVAALNRQATADICAMDEQTPGTDKASEPAKPVKPDPLLLKIAALLNIDPYADV